MEPLHVVIHTSPESTFEERRAATASAAINPADKEKFKEKPTQEPLLSPTSEDNDRTSLLEGW